MRNKSRCLWRRDWFCGLLREKFRKNSWACPMISSILKSSFWKNKTEQNKNTKKNTEIQSSVYLKKNDLSCRSERALRSTENCCLNKVYAFHFSWAFHRAKIVIWTFQGIYKQTKSNFKRLQNLIHSTSFRAISNWMSNTNRNCFVFVSLRHVISTNQIQN